MKNLFLSVLAFCGLFMWTATLRSQPVSDSAVRCEGEQVASEGAWCWFADPRALHYENEAGTINCSYLGYIDVHGAVKAVQYDFLRKRRTEVLVRSYFQPDDHNNPTFLVLPDERIMIFYSRHTDEPCFYYRISQRPGDIATLGEEHKILVKDNTTYPSPFILSEDPEHIYLCWRGINWHPTIARLTLPDTDDCVQIDWGPYQMVQSSGARPYAKYCSNGKDYIMLAYTTGHPDNELPNWLYFSKVNIKTLQLEDVKGRVLSTIMDGPFRVNRTEQFAMEFPDVVADRTAGMRDWVWQLDVNKNGWPVMAMVKISADKTVHDYYSLSWNGREWNDFFLAHGGGHFHQSPDIEHCYSGGLAMDISVPGTYYCSVPVTGEQGRRYEIVKYEVDEEFRTVRKTYITQNSRKNNVRPYVLPSSVGSPLRLVWMNGDYYDWIVSSSRPGYPTSIHGDFRWTEEVKSAESDLLAFEWPETDRVIAGGERCEIKVPHDVQHADFTLFLSVSKPVGGVLCAGSGWSWGIDSLQMRPVLTFGDEVQYGNNILGSSDSWSRYGRGTNGLWYAPEPYSHFTVALVREGRTLTTFINGMVDQWTDGDFRLERLLLGGSGSNIDGYALYGRALTPAEIAVLISQCR